MSRYISKYVITQLYHQYYDVTNFYHHDKNDSPAPVSLVTTNMSTVVYYKLNTIMPLTRAQNVHESKSVLLY